MPRMAVVFRSLIVLLITIAPLHATRAMAGHVVAASAATTAAHGVSHEHHGIHASPVNYAEHRAPDNDSGDRASHSCGAAHACCFTLPVLPAVGSTPQRSEHSADCIALPASRAWLPDLPPPRG